MARRTWGQIKSEAVLELKNRTDISTRMEGWLRESFFEAGYGYKFHELENTATFTLLNVNEKTFAAMGITDLKFILSLRDTTNKRRITPATFRYIDNLADNITQPHYYCRFATSLLFDGSPSTSISYRLRYKRKITEPVYTGSVYPDTPEEWDEVIRLLAVSRGFQALHETNNANATEQRVQRLIARLPVEEEVDSDDDVVNLTVRNS